MVSVKDYKNIFYNRAAIKQNRCATQSKLSGSTGIGDGKCATTSPRGAQQVRECLFLLRTSYCIGHVASTVHHDPRVYLCKG